MRLGVLAWSEHEGESLGLVRTGEQRGHDTSLFMYDDIRLESDLKGLPRVTVAGEDLNGFDVILSRGYVGWENYRESVQKLLLLSSVPGPVILDAAAAHVAGVSKMSMLARLSNAGLPVPPTRLCGSAEDFEAAFDDWGPLVLKPAVGFGGHDVERFLDRADGISEVRRLLDKFGTLLAQPFLEHEGDIRVSVVGDAPSVCVKALTSGPMWRPNHNDGWGPTPELNEVVRFDPPAEMIDLAIAGAQALGFSLAGADIIERDGELTLIEVNGPAFGWEGWPQEWQQEVNDDVLALAESRYLCRPR